MAASPAAHAWLEKVGKLPKMVSAALPLLGLAVARLQVLHTTTPVIRYAEIAAGRASCAAADRVLGIDQLDQALVPSAAGRGAGPMQTDARAPAG